jgi:hypothetical protein
VAYASVTNAMKYHPATSDDPDRARLVLKTAASMVQSLAPSPYAEGEESEAYIEKAETAELMLFAYFWDTGGYQTSYRIGQMQGDFGTGSEDIVARIVSRAMGAYGSTRRVTSVPIQRG